MNTLNEFVEFAFGLAITMLCLAYTFWTMTAWPDHFEQVPSATTVFVEQTEIPEEVLWTGTQVVAKLYQLSDELIPISIEGYTFQTEKDVRMNQHRVSISSQYSSDVTIDSTGQVTHITFTRKGA